jgi:hypothetical protein
MCTIVGNKCDTQLNKIRNAEAAASKDAAPAAAPPAQARSTVPVRSNKPDPVDIRLKAASEADKYFGISDPLSESGEPIIKINSQPDLEESYIKKQLKIQEQKIVKVSPGSASKYMDIRPDTSSKSFATDEAVVDQSEWEKAYIQVRARTPALTRRERTATGRAPKVSRNGQNVRDVCISFGGMGWRMSMNASHVRRRTGTQTEGPQTAPGPYPE